MLASNPIIEGAVAMDGRTRVRARALHVAARGSQADVGRSPDASLESRAWI
jgi:hypothetical protein